MPEQQDTSNDQDARTGGYGGSTGGANPPTDPGGASAAGRDNPVTDPIDGDEAMGNRTGGYGYPTKDAGTEDAGTEP